MLKVKLILILGMNLLENYYINELILVIWKLLFLSMSFFLNNFIYYFLWYYILWGVSYCEDVLLVCVVVILFVGCILISLYFYVMSVMGVVVGY